MKKVLKNPYMLPILSLYTFTSLLFLVVFSIGYYNHEKEEILRDERNNIKIIAQRIKLGVKERFDVSEIQALKEGYKLNLVLDGRDVFKEFDMPIFRGDFLETDEHIYYKHTHPPRPLRGGGGGGIKNEHKISEKEQKHAELAERAERGARGVLAERALSESQIYAGEKSTFATAERAKPHGERSAFARQVASEPVIELMASVPSGKIFALFVWLLCVCVGVLAVICAVSYVLLRLSYRPFLVQIERLNNFIADTTHEINTPLSVILMSIELFPKNPSKYLQNIKIASKTLSGIYNDLALNLRDEPTKMSRVFVRELLNEKVELLQGNAKEISFCVTADNVVLVTDGLKLGKIVENLLSNAVKYSFSGSEVKIFLSASGLSVENRGETIAKENLERIYEKFSRFNSNSGTGGFGIGLNLVKRYCDELKFKVRCESKENVTRFVVEF